MVSFSSSKFTEHTQCLLHIRHSVSETKERNGQFGCSEFKELTKQPKVLVSSTDQVLSFSLDTEFTQLPYDVQVLTLSLFYKCENRVTQWSVNSPEITALGNCSLTLGWMLKRLEFAAFDRHIQGKQCLSAPKK